MLQKYLSRLPASSDLSARKSPTQQSGHTVILTGSTGSLSSYLLENLARHPKIQKVYCLNQRSDAEDRQIESNSSRGLVSVWGTRVAFLHADLSSPHLGLSEEAYTNLVKEATVIIRNSSQLSTCRTFRGANVVIRQSMAS
jgi:thioester reductase-like protein